MGEISWEISPIADMLLVTLLEIGVEVLISEKKTSSLVEDVRLMSVGNRFAWLRGFERFVKSGV